ncbi:hypothetical protein COS81_03435 [candidate division WWE3 bacterium CG06_land_8_20_14_3_00_42_16]|uniref:NAD-dependent epimerase/dehydratase domain-containing protein n=2 Tax=Katanobacteria TaxID=422282 RepID=A0A2M7AMJ3_UNCKA|nr:MAG: hypothetical protein COS81_03435 [candidate division WWE3 bacterium CG06_land_8_20_14_3_00_42_16]PIZ43543.1 MAG: hypothetical protein COY34_00680 [candidate division WWE3 bacterium CG_4_10_14_0_2_um_filter_42_8]
MGLDTKLSRKTRTRSLVVGGAGFIGSHLCEALLAQNQTVVCLDDLTTGSTENLLTAQRDPHFTFIEGDLSLADFSSFKNVDYIFHLAGLEAYLQEVKPSLQTLLTNSLGTKNLLDFALRTEAKFLFASTVDIYSGVASSLSLKFYYGKTEEDESRFSHNEAKRFGEALVEEYQNKYHLNTRVVRLADVYGSRMNLEADSPLNRLFAQAIEKKSLVVGNDGLRIFHPTYIGDVVYGIQRAALLDNTEAGIYYLVNPQEVEVYELAQLLSQQEKMPLKVEFQKSEEILLPPAKIEIAKSKEELRWEPKVSLKEGIKFTLLYFNQAENLTSQAQVTQEVQPKSKVAGQEEEASGMDKKSSSPFKFSFKNLLHSAHKPAEEAKEPKSDFKKLSSQKKDQPEGESPTKHAGVKPVKILILVASLSLVLIGLVGPLLSSLFFSYRGVKALEKAKADFSQLKFTQAQSELQKAAKSFNVANRNLEDLQWFATLFHWRDTSQDVSYLLSAAEDVSRALFSVSVGIEPVFGGIQNTLNPDPQEKNDFQKITRLADIEYTMALNKLSEAQAKIGAVRSQNFPPFLATKISQLEIQTLFAKEIIGKASLLNRLLPTIVGQNEDKVYLLLFQNNMERRATGGFIGSYGRILLKEGLLAEIKVDDIYNPDGLSKETIIPPAPLKQYLKVESWGMRDANWSPDFSKTAEQMIELYEKATSDRVDGVMALDLFFVEDLLRELGPMVLVDKGETITADNLFEKAEYYAEVNFKPGSEGKSDFLGDLGFQITQTLKTLPLSRWLNLVQVLQQDLQTKHLLLYFKEPVLEDLVLEQNWGGKVQETAGDFLWVVDSNVGGNKADYFVDRQVQYTVEVGRDGELTAQVLINYQHRGESEAWPGGTYKDYLRVYTPLGSKLATAENFIDGPATEEDLGYTVFAGYLEVSPTTTQIVSLAYSLPDKLVLGKDNLTYSFMGQKQAGARDEAFQFAMSWPQYLTLQSADPQGEILSQTYKFQTLLNSDQPVVLQFQNKASSQ